jgi:hypothetical protein
VKNTPDKEQVENFWKEIYEKKVQHNEAACWIKNQYQQNPGMEWNPVCVKDVAEALFQFQFQFQFYLHSIYLIQVNIPKIWKQSDQQTCNSN